MKFQFLVIDKDQVRKGSLQARDLGNARFVLEEKGFVVKELAPAQDTEKQIYLRTLGVILCLVGFTAFVWSFAFQSTRIVATKSTSRINLDVEGKLVGDLSEVGKIQVLFPEIPVRLEASWPESDQGEGRFLVQREFLSNRSTPTYFHLKVLDRHGEVLVQKTRIPYDGIKGKAELGQVSVGR